MMNQALEFRVETDSLGQVNVPKNALYGGQSMRSLDNFPITGSKTHPMMIRAIGMIKKACVLANFECGQISEDKVKYIVQACDEVIDNKLDEHFITDKIQGGAGTSVNMNANEVIANRAAQLAGKEIGIYDFIHPNDDVNKSQSTNDVYPTAGKLTALILIDTLIKEIEMMQTELLIKSEEFDDVFKVGRTHLQDAVPIRLGQEFHAFHSSFVRDLERIKVAFSQLYKLNLGATAIGTGINADERFQGISVSKLKDISGMDLTSVKDLIDGTRNVDPFVYAHSALKIYAVNLSKMCNDLRLMASGPRAGFSEIYLPAKQPGSSIMPGKVNPVIPEVCNQVCFEVFGNDITVTKAAEAGQLELNVFEPIIFLNLFQSIEILSNATKTLRINAIKQIQANREYCKDCIEDSLGIITALAPRLGYSVASKLAKTAMEEDCNLRELLQKIKIMSDSDINEVLDIRAMTYPGIPGKSNQ